MQGNERVILKQVKLHTSHNEMLIEMGEARKRKGLPNVSKQGIVGELIIKAYNEEIENDNMLSR